LTPLAADRSDASVDTPPIWARSASALVRSLASGELTSVEVTEAHLARIAELDGRLRAFTQVRRDEALREAAEADGRRASGEPLGPLHGLPVSVKECFDWQGECTTVGFPARQSTRANADAALLTLIRRAGAVVLGRTNLSQGMIYAESRNPIFGATSNAFSLGHTSGGSSGGEATALAAGMSPLGFGTDIAGSVRGPAHFSGICGFIPTLDRWPMAGVTPGIPGQEAVRATCGPMARSVEDLELAWRAIDTVLASRLDPRVAPLPPEAPRDDVKGLRIAWWEHDGHFEPSPAVARAVREAAAHLEAAGCELVQSRPKALDDAIHGFLGALSADGTRMLARQLEGGAVDPLLASLLQLGTLPRPARRAAARRDRQVERPRALRQGRCAAGCAWRAARAHA
jgi:fatty acid amide hydrolase